jgi:hypothetical protein
MVGVHLRAIGPEPFYGLVEEDALQWMNRLTAYFTAANTDEAMKCTVLGLLLRNVALVWFKGLDIADRTTATEFEELLEKPFLVKFNGKNVRWMTRQKMESRVMRTNETVDDYIREMICMASRLEIDGTTLAPSLIRGLRPDVKMQLMALQPEGFDDTVEKIRLAETIANMRDMGAAFGVPYSAKQGENDQITKLEKKISNLTKNLSDVMIASTSETPPSPPPRRKPPPRYDSAPHRHWREPPQHNHHENEHISFHDPRSHPRGADDPIDVISDMFQHFDRDTRRPRHEMPGRRRQSWTSRQEPRAPATARASTPDRAPPSPRPLPSITHVPRAILPAEYTEPTLN